MAQRERFVDRMLSGYAQIQRTIKLYPEKRVMIRVAANLPQWDVVKEWNKGKVQIEGKVTDVLLRWGTTERKWENLIEILKKQEKLYLDANKAPKSKRIVLIREAYEKTKVGCGKLELIHVLKRCNITDFKEIKYDDLTEEEKKEYGDDEGILLIGPPRGKAGGRKTKDGAPSKAKQKFDKEHKKDGASSKGRRTNEENDNAGGNGVLDENNGENDLEMDENDNAGGNSALDDNNNQASEEKENANGNEALDAARIGRPQDPCTNHIVMIYKAENVEACGDFETGDRVFYREYCNGKKGQWNAAIGIVSDYDAQKGYWIWFNAGDDGDWYQDNGNILKCEEWNYATKKWNWNEIKISTRVDEYKLDWESLLMPEGTTWEEHLNNNATYAVATQAGKEYLKYKEEKKGKPKK